MNEKDELERCNYNAHAISRPKSAKELNLNQLPSKCSRHIMSFMNYEKVSQMRQVSKKFNETGKYLLDKGHRKLGKRLKAECERALWRRVFCPINLRSWYDLIRFLNGLRQAINNCTITYAFQINYFIAGKLLDEVNYLLNDFNSSTMVPYIPEHTYGQQPHPILAPIITHSERAYTHFRMEILEKFIDFDEAADYKRYLRSDFKHELQYRQNKMRIAKMDLLKKRKQTIYCGNKINGEFLKLIFKLNKQVLDLTLKTRKVDEEVEERINNNADVSIVPTCSKGGSNCLAHSYAPSRGSTNVMKIKAGSEQRRPLNLATLPDLCLQDILSYSNCGTMAHLRLVCKSFNAACKKRLNEEYEKVQQKLEFKIKYENQIEIDTAFKILSFRTNFMKDACSLLQLCKDTYRWHLGTNYCFLAGKVLDEAKNIYNELAGFNSNYLDCYYNYRPHYNLFCLMDLVYAASAHLKFHIVPKYFPSIQIPKYIPDFIIAGDATSFINENQLNLKEIAKLIEEADVKIENQNERNRKFVKIIFNSKKNVFILNKEISKNINLLKLI